MSFVYKILCERGWLLKTFLCFFNFGCTSIKPSPLVVNRYAIIANFLSRACWHRLGITILKRIFQTIPCKNENKFFLFQNSYMIYSSSSISFHNWKLTTRLYKAKFSLFPDISLRQISLRGPCNYTLSKHDIIFQAIVF